MHGYAAEKANNNTRKIDYLGDITSEDNEESESGEIRQITHTHKKNKIIPDNKDHYGVEIKIYGEKQKLIIDTGSPVTIMPKNPTLCKPEVI